MMLHREAGRGRCIDNLRTSDVQGLVSSLGVQQVVSSRKEHDRGRENSHRHVDDCVPIHSTGPMVSLLLKISQLRLVSQFADRGLACHRSSLRTFQWVLRPLHSRVPHALVSGLPQFGVLSALCPPFDKMKAGMTVRIMITKCGSQDQRVCECVSIITDMPVSGLSLRLDLRRSLRMKIGLCSR